MKLKSLLKGVVRAAGALVGSQIGGPAGAAIGAGLATKLTGGSNQEAVLGGLVSGIGAYALPKVGEKLGLSSQGLFGAPAGAGGDMGYINSEAGGGGMARGIANLATSPAGLAALGAGTLALAPSERPAAASPTAPARDNRTLEQMGYDTSPLERTYRPYEGDPYAYGEAGAEQRYFARGGRVRRGIAHFDDGGAVSLDAISDAGYDASSIDASGGIAGALGGTGFSFDADSGVSTPPAPVDFSVPEGVTVPAMAPAPAAPAGAPARGGDTSIIGRGLSFLQNQAQDVINNPGRTAVNVAASAIPVVGQLNTVSGLLGGPTLGAGLMSAIQGMTGYGKGVPGDADGDGVITTGDDYANYGDYYGGNNGAPDSISYDPLTAGKDAAQVAQGTGSSSLQPVGSGSPDAGAGLQGIGRSYLSPSFDAYHYGEVMPEARFYAARGGLARGPSPAQMAMAAFERGGKVSGPGDGQSDDIPAMLSDGEYVMDADTVAALGNGSNEAGAKKLDAMRKRIRAQKRRAPVGKIPPKAKGLGHYLGGAV